MDNEKEILLALLNERSQIIIESQQDMKKDLKSLQKSVNHLEKQLAVQQVKSGFWGTFGGIAASFLIKFINII